MASSSSSSSRPSHPPRSTPFTSIAEREGEEEEIKQASTKSTAMNEAPVDTFPYKHQPTPLHQHHHPKKTTSTPPISSISVLCNKCRPSPCDKTFVVPFDLKSPNSAPKAILSFLTRGKSPRPPPTSTTTPSPAEDAQYWKLAAAELSRKLVHAARKRDEALLEASRLKQSVSHLEHKLTRLESDCLDLRSSLDSHHHQPVLFPTDTFLSAVSSARSAVRALARSNRAGSPLVQVEASINRLFYDDFEKPAAGEEGGGVLDPAARCGLNMAAYEAVRGITWEDVLTKGAKHYNEGLSRFCDRKMGEVVGVLGWERAWPESLLQAFFAAAKGVWLVGLLARCVHPPVPVLRVEGGARFDPAYMEDVAPGERVRRLAPASVRTLVAPGFYVYSGGAGVLKCKVLCTYVRTAVV